MATTFFQIIHDYVINAPSDELIKIKKLIDAQLGDTSTFDGKARYIKITEGNLHAVKYIRDEKGWDVKTCLQYVNNL